MSAADDEGARVLWLDAFTANVDRSWRNPNLLLWHGDLWVIDHGASLYFHHGWRPASPTRRSSPRRRGTSAATSSRSARAARASSTRRSRPGSSRDVFVEVLAEVPDVWLEPVPGAETPDALRAAYVDFLVARLGTRQWLPEASRDATRLAYQYVVLRCVPRPEREEFVNVGVVLHCQAADFLDVAWSVDADRLRALHPDLDVDQVCDALDVRRRGVPRRRARGRGRTAVAGTAVRLPQGPAQHRAPARPGARRADRPTRPVSSSTCCERLVG